MLRIEQDLDLSSVLEGTVHSATDLAGACCGALGVLGTGRHGFAQFVAVGADTEEMRFRICRLQESNDLLRALTTDPRPVRLSGLHKHEAVDEPAAGSNPIRSLLGVPILVHGEPYANLYLCDKKKGGEFTEEDQELASALALAAGLAIDKAGLHTRLRELTLNEERERIARNLHDTVIQRLFAVGLSLQGAIRLVGRSEARDRIQRSVEDLDETIRQIRSAIFAVSRTRHSEARGLRSEILEVTDEAAGGLGLDVRVDFEGSIDTAVGIETAEHLLVTVREAIANVVRHARATSVELHVKADEAGLDLRVIDDGVGIDPVHAEAARGGLGNLTERAKLLGGSCSVSPRVGGGTELRWQVRNLG
jgi:signal transduction histidine kinase